jgi:hypothetical protein
LICASGRAGHRKLVEPGDAGSAGKSATDVFSVTNETKVILGVTTTVVHDQVFVKGELVEDTFDWFAQDGAGNVW